MQLDELDAGDTFLQFRERESDHLVFSILRRSFDTLTQEDQLLFVDVALYIPEQWRADIIKRLSLVHGVRENVLQQRFMGLKRKSVLDEVDDGTRKVGMHDLWREFAVTEAKNGDRERQRWVYDVVDNPRLRSEEGVVVGARFGGGWVNLQRVCIMRSWRTYCDMECRRVQSMDDLDSMPFYIRVKYFGTFRSCMLLCPLQTGQLRRSTPGAESMILVDEVNFRSCVDVTVLRLVRPTLKVLDLSALQNLKSLEISSVDCSRFTCNSLPPPRLKVRGLGGLSSLVILLLDNIPTCSSWLEQVSGLSRLQILGLGCDFSDFLLPGERENRYPDLRRLLLLEELSIRRFYNKSNTISGFSKGMSHLRILDLSGCSFSRCDGVGDLIALEELYLSCCTKLIELPNLQRLTKLRKSDFHTCVFLTELEGFGALVALEELEATECSKLAQLPDLSKLIHLEALDLLDSPMSALMGLGNAISLRKIAVSFEGLEDCHDLQMLTELQTVCVQGWGSQGLPCLSTLPKLEDLCITKCKEMVVLTGLLNLTSVLRLEISLCDFKDVSCVGQVSTLRELSLSHCRKLQRLPDIQKLTRLESLDIWWCDSLRIWDGLRGSGLLEKERSFKGSSLFPLLNEMLKCNGVPITDLPDMTSFPYLKELRLLKP